MRESIYRSYRRKGSLVRQVHLRILRSRAVAKAVFGVPLPSEADQPTYFDLTTFLLHRHLRRKLRRLPRLGALEIGAGAYCILAGSLSRYAARPIVATEVDPGRAASARAHVAANALPVRVEEADLFPRSPGPFDLIFWNLPYYRDPDSFLVPLLHAVADHLTERGELVLGFNGRALCGDAVLTLLGELPCLELRRRVTWRWNLHEILEIGLARGGVRERSQS